MRISKRVGFTVSRRQNSNGVYHFEVYLGRVGGKRVRRYFPTKDEADTFAEQQRVLRINQGTAALSLSDKERIEATDCIHKLEAVGASLTVATEFYLRHAKPSGGTRTCQEALTEMLVSKKEEDKKDTYIKALRWSLGKFNRTFGEREVNTVFRQDVEKWLSDQNFKSPSTRRAYIRDIKLFFSFCTDRSYAPANPVEKLKKPKPGDRPPTVFSIKETKRLLDAAEAHPELNITAGLAIALFTGVRTSELRKLDWSEVKLKRKTIEVTAIKSKTAKRRLLKITANLRQWITPFIQEEGPVVPKRWREQLLKLRNLANVKWKPNGSRHTFASYHVAAHEDANATALLLGHADTTMLFNQYRSLVDPADAKAFWRILPRVSLPPAKNG